MFDLIIKGGTVVDGTKSPPFRADVGIQGTSIAAVGELHAASAPRTIDAAGQIVAPGFIDVHTHMDGWLLKTPHIPSKTLQGYTTEIIMVDGISYAPVNPHTARQWMYYLRALDGLHADEYQGWRTLADYLNLLDGRNVQNVATHIPYANVRALACGFGSRRVDDFQLRSIQAEIAQGMEQGAVGLSTGLDYIVQCFSTTDELVEACSAMSDKQGLYVTHVRYKKGLLPALREAVEIARRANVPLHVSHLKQSPVAPAEEVLGYIDAVARHEVDLSFEVYPYQPGSSMLTYLLPYEVWEDGPLAVPAKLRDPAVRERFRAGLTAFRLNLDRIRIAWVATDENRIHQGKTLAQYVAEQGCAAEDALAELLIAENLAVLLVFDEGDDVLAEPFLAHDLSMIGTDGIYAENGPVHPRQFGTVGRLLGHIVRERKLMSLEEAVHKLSGRPAARFGLVKRGQVREGYFADLVVFDAATVASPAAFADPRRYTTGISTVLVNGTVIVAESQPVDQLPTPLPGRFLKFLREG